MTATNIMSKRPLIVAGPCCAENKEQMLATAQQLGHLKNVSIFRAGVWKARSDPKNFEGPGEKGLHWHREVKKRTGFSTATEVAKASHVELCLKYNIDVLWIGARTVVNPFHVQEIADALKGVQIPVMVKNPMVPDISLWIGAIERFSLANVKEVIAVHRGFTPFEKIIYRNAPIWDIPLQLKSTFPALPIICDPSHIAGKRELIEHISQQAVSFGLDGLMIEAHHCPAKALSDRHQQITPNSLQSLLQKTYSSKHSHLKNSFKDELEQLRQQIDLVDKDIMASLSLRESIIKKIGTLKNRHNIPLHQEKRFMALLKKQMALAKKKGMREEFVCELYQQIHRESLHIQHKMLKSQLNTCGQTQKDSKVKSLN